MIAIGTAIENQKKDQAFREFNQMLQVEPITKFNTLLHSMAQIDAFSVTITLTFLIVTVGLIYPKVKVLLARSNRAAFILIALGLGLILYILR